MKIIDKIEQAQKDKHIAYSFEYFPPKTELVSTKKLIYRKEKERGFFDVFFCFF